MDPFSIFMTVASMAMSMQQQAQQQKAQRQAMQRQADKAAKERWEAYEKSEKQRKDQLKKALAKKRARMGASGLSAADGSSGAIIQGLRNDKAEATYEDFTDNKKQIDETISGMQASLLEKSDAARRSAYSKLGSVAESFIGDVFSGIGETAKAPKAEPDYTKELPGQLYTF